MPAPVFGPNEIDQNPGSVSLSLTPGATPGGDFWRNYFQQGMNSTRAGVPLDTSNANAARTWQQQLIQDLQQQAAGNPNSVAQKQLESSYTNARAGASALGSSVRGTGGGAGLRAGVQGAGNVQRGFEGDKAALMLQEQQAAQALLAQQLAAERGLDASQAQAMAQNSLANTGLDNAMMQFYTGGGINNALAGTNINNDRARATMGFDLEGRALENELMNRYAGAAATATAAAGNAFGQRNNRTSYRQVDGQNSIVPEWDK